MEKKIFVILVFAVSTLIFSIGAAVSGIIRLIELGFVIIPVSIPTWLGVTMVLIAVPLALYIGQQFESEEAK